MIISGKSFEYPLDEATNSAIPPLHHTSSESDSNKTYYPRLLRLSYGINRVMLLSPFLALTPYLHLYLLKWLSLAHMFLHSPLQVPSLHHEPQVLDPQPLVLFRESAVILYLKILESCGSSPVL